MESDPETDRTVDVGLGDGEGELVFNGDSLFRKVEFWKCMVVMAAQQCACTYCH